MKTSLTVGCTHFLRLAFYTALFTAGFFLSSSHFLFLSTLTPILFWSCKLNFFKFFFVFHLNNHSIVNSSLLAVTSELNIPQKERILNSKVTARRLTKHKNSTIMYLYNYFFVCFQISTNIFFKNAFLLYLISELCLMYLGIVYHEAAGCFYPQCDVSGGRLSVFMFH